jgi:hypothetical protein
MKKLLRSGIFFFLILSGFVLAETRAAEESPEGQFRREFEAINTRLTNIEKQQKDIAAKDDLIVEKLDQLRVWVHRK